MSAIDNLTRWEDHPDYECGRYDARLFVVYKNAMGWTIDEICAALCVSDTWVRDAMKFMGVRPYYSWGVTKTKKRRTKISDDQVRAIRADKKRSNRSWAEELGIHVGHVSAIKNRRFRRDV